MKSERRRRLTEGLILGLLFYAANIRGLVVSGIFPLQGAWIEATTEFVLMVAALWLLAKSGSLERYKSLWLGNRPLIAFIGLAAASLFWTIDMAATLSRVLILILSTMLAAYLAVRYTLPEVLRIVAGFFAVLVVLCIVIVIVWRDAGMMNFEPYYGSWRGIFWHRNYLGSTMALGALIFLFCTCLSWQKERKQALFYGSFYLLAIALVALSRSATGLILLILLHILFGGTALWLAWYSKLRAVHYWILGGLLAIMVTIGYLKLDFILGIFNRESTFTGRAGLWSYLLDNVISQRPLLGHGFGALWLQDSFRLALRDALGWAYPVVIGDNGYVDILLHVGAIGLVIFAAVLVMSWARTARLAFRERTLLAFVPVLVMTYVLITNITLSYFLETESFTWIVMMAFVFAATKTAKAGGGG